MKADDIAFTAETARPDIGAGACAGVCKAIRVGNAIARRTHLVLHSFLEDATSQALAIAKRRAYLRPEHPHLVADIYRGPDRSSNGGNRDAIEHVARLHIGCHQRAKPRPNRALGLYLMVDVGAMTLDVCAFRLGQTDAATDLYGLLAAQVRPLGVEA
uniref:hypothetical protein n=1 Tax=Bradyrhizobium sp. (strain ORS 278) TaxID=114615 RepID=UPI00138A24D6|nr:hypothetical protein [Bradyrhizobium sp. ORS 278]